MTRSQSFVRFGIGLGIAISLVLCSVFSFETAKAAYEPLLYAPPRPVCKPLPIRSVKTTQKVVAMTFDDGPWPVHTQGILNHLSMYGARSTFFMVSNNAQAYPDIAREALRRGHEIANHSVDHASYNPSVIASQIGVANWELRQVTGVIPWMFRPPGLTQGKAIDERVAHYKMCNIFTDNDLGDWRSPRASAWVLCERFKQQLHPGYIALLHDGGSHAETVKAVPCMLAHAKKQGYKFATVSQLLNMGTHVH